MTFFEAIANHTKAIMEQMDAARCVRQAESTLTLMRQRKLMADANVEKAIHAMNDAAKELCQCR